MLDKKGNITYKTRYVANYFNNIHLIVKYMKLFRILNI